MSETVLTGKILLIGEKQTFDSGFAKREFVIETNDDYPQKIKFELLKDKADNLEKYEIKEGDTVNVKFNIRGSEWNGKYFVNLVAWMVSKNSNATKDSGKSTVVDAEPQAGNNEEDDLPF